MGVTFAFEIALDNALIGRPTPLDWDEFEHEDETPRTG